MIIITNNIKNSVNQTSSSVSSSYSSDNSSVKVVLGARLTGLLAKLATEFDPSKQAELRGQINQVRQQMTDIELQEARAKTIEEDRTLRMNLKLGISGNPL